MLRYSPYIKDKNTTKVKQKSLRFVVFYILQKSLLLR